MTSRHTRLPLLSPAITRVSMTTTCYNRRIVILYLDILILIVIII